MIKYKKITIDYAIYIKVFSDGTLPYLMVYTDNVVNTNNNKKTFTQLRRVENKNKVQDGYVLKYLNVHTCQSLLGFSVDHIM